MQDDAAARRWRDTLLVKAQEVVLEAIRADNESADVMRSAERALRMAGAVVGPGRRNERANDQETTARQASTHPGGVLEPLRANVEAVVDDAEASEGGSLYSSQVHSSKPRVEPARAHRALDRWAALLPQRVVNEDLGDYIEDINRRAAEGQRWLIWVRVVVAILTTAVNSVGYVRKALGKATVR
jgi:hypothetical protein